MADWTCGMKSGKLYALKSSRTLYSDDIRVMKHLEASEPFMFLEASHSVVGICGCTAIRILYVESTYWMFFDTTANKIRHWREWFEDFEVVEDE